MEASQRCNKKSALITLSILLSISLALAVITFNDNDTKLSLALMSLVSQNNNNIDIISQYCNSDNRRQIYILYLCQGSPLDIIPPFYYHFFNNSLNDFIFLDYKGSKDKNGTDTGEYKLFRSDDSLSDYNRNSFTFTVIHYPNQSLSSWIEGRNHLLSYAFMHEKLNKKCKYNYWCVLDDDIEFIDTHHLKDMHSFEAMLIQYSPAIAVPNLLEMYHRQPYNNRSHSSIALNQTNCVPFRNNWICPIGNYDPMITYFHREVIDNKLVIPYPHPWKEGYSAWWCYHYYSAARVTVLFRNYILLYDGWKMKNILHRPYERGGVRCWGSTCQSILNISAEFQHCFVNCKFEKSSIYNCEECWLPNYGEIHGIIGMKNSNTVNYTLFNWTNIDANNCIN